MSLGKIAAITCGIKDQGLFPSLISFISYYQFIIEFYSKNIENIISVKELLLLKYIDMIKDLLAGFNENSSANLQRTEMMETLKTINDKLYSTVKEIKEQGEMNLSVDLRTMQDLIKSDF